MHHALQSSLAAPADDDAASVELYRMLAAFPVRAEQAEISVAMRVEAYFTAVGKMPAWALRKAVDEVLMGEAGLDAKWAPTPPQLAEIVRKHMRPTREAITKLGQLLAAEVELPEPDAAELERRRLRVEEMMRGTFR